RIACARIDLPRPAFERLLREFQPEPAVRARDENDCTFDLHDPSFHRVNETMPPSRTAPLHRRYRSAGASRCPRPAAPQTRATSIRAAGVAFASFAKSATLNVNFDHHCLCDALCQRILAASMVITIVFFNRCNGRNE